MLQDEGGHLKIGEYWVQMLYEQINPDHNGCMLHQIPYNWFSRLCYVSNQCQFTGKNSDGPLDETEKDIRTFGFIYYQVRRCIELYANIQIDKN